MTVGIYAGIVTVDEAAALGLLLTLGFAFFRRQLTWKKLIRELIDGAGNIFSHAMTESGLAQGFVQWVLGLGLPPLAIIFVLVLGYIALGAVFDALAAMILTLPFVLPIILQLGYDPVWWGILNVMIIEVGMISPPVGINIFVFHGMRPEIPLGAVYRGTIPFVIAGLARIALLIVFPAIATVLL